MKTLLIGGSGCLGSLVIPYLEKEHEIRVLDIVAPSSASVEYVEGSVADPQSIRRALNGMEAVVYMVLKRNPDGSRATDDVDAAYDLNVKGPHQVLQAMVDAGLRRAVYASSLSVHRHYLVRYDDEKTQPCDAPDIYGFTKRLGERVCEYFVRVHGLSIAALRLTGPVSVEQWHQGCRPGLPRIVTSAPDVARAISLALTTPFTGFHALFISGDHEGIRVNCARARTVLGWQPLERPRETHSLKSEAS